MVFGRRQLWQFSDLHSASALFYHFNVANNLCQKDVLDSKTLFRGFVSIPFRPQAEVVM